MAIDVEAVCAEWRRLGGEVREPPEGSRAMRLYAPGADLERCAGYVYPELLSAFSPLRDFGEYTVAAAAIGVLPELARVWDMRSEHEECAGSRCMEAAQAFSGLCCRCEAAEANPDQHAGYKAALDAFCGVGSRGQIWDRQRRGEVSDEQV